MLRYAAAAHTQLVAARRIPGAWSVYVGPTVAATTWVAVGAIGADHCVRLASGHGEWTGGAWPGNGRAGERLRRLASVLDVWPDGADGVGADNGSDSEGPSQLLPIYKDGFQVHTGGELLEIIRNDPTVGSSSRLPAPRADSRLFEPTVGSTSGQSSFCLLVFWCGELHHFLYFGGAWGDGTRER